MHISKYLFNLAKTPVGGAIVGLAFGKLSSVLPVNKIYENEYVLAFWHPEPFWDKHILIVPKKHVKGLTSICESDKEYIYEMYKAVRAVVEKLGWNDKDYSILTNGGTRQEVNQLHTHLFSGNELS